MTLLSLPHLTMLAATPPQVVTAAASAGFSAVGLRLIPTMQGEAQHPMIGETQMMRETLSLLSNHGLRVLDIEAIWLKPKTRVRDFVSAIEAAAKLGARSLQVIGNDSDESRLVDRFSELCALAAPYGLNADLEFMRFAEVRTLSHAQRIVEASGASNAGILLDALHFFRCGTALDDLVGLDKTRIHVVQLCDAPLKTPDTFAEMLHEARFDRLLPGKGELPLSKFMAALPADVPLSIEVPLAPQHGISEFGEIARQLKTGADRFLEQLNRSPALQAVREK
jgi:sugar phosphate isomerase/epimerase